jgi:hypothetical protein
VRVAYFVHDLSDPAVSRRVRMLRLGGAEVVVLGFRRTAIAPEQVDVAPAVDLGRSFDGQLKRRAASVLGQLLAAPALGRHLRGADVVMARSLESLVLAEAARALHRPGARLVYECLDIHRLMISNGPAGRALRALERALLRRCQLLVVSSEAFRRAYFEPLQGLGTALRTPVLLAENKVLETAGGRPDQGSPRQPGPPWRIGWFGMLRCRCSFEVLRGLAAALPGKVEVVISGRPSERELPDLAAEAARAPGIVFTGAYGPGDLERMYRQVHFAWAIDHFEEGANSDWLLPNRIYESGRYGAVPIALRTVETGRWLEARGLGLLTDETQLGAILSAMDGTAYRALEERSLGAPLSWFTAGDQECHELVQALMGQAPPRLAERTGLKAARSPSFPA